MEKNIIAIIFAIGLCVSVTFAQTIKGSYAIKNVKTGLLLRIKDANKEDGTPLVAYTPENWKCMTWDFNHVDGDTYILKNLLSGKTFQTQKENPTADDALNEKPLNNTPIQQYEFIPVKKDIYLIKLKSTDLYLTPADEKGKINSLIIF